MQSNENTDCDTSQYDYDLILPRILSESHNCIEYRLIARPEIVSYSAYSSVYWLKNKTHGHW